LLVATKGISATSFPNTRKTPAETIVELRKDKLKNVRIKGIGSGNQYTERKKRSE